jgi:phasin family protein
MQTALFAQWENMTKVTTGNLKQLAVLNLRLTEKLLQQQLGLISDAVKESNRVVALISDGKAVPELLAEQTKLASEYSNKFFEATRDATQIVAASREDYRAWFERSAKDWSEQVRSVFAATVPASRKAA